LRFRRVFRLEFKHHLGYPVAQIESFAEVCEVGHLQEGLLLVFASGISSAADLRSHVVVLPELPIALELDVLPALVFQAEAL